MTMSSKKRTGLGVFLFFLILVPLVDALYTLPRCIISNWWTFDVRFSQKLEIVPDYCDTLRAANSPPFGSGYPDYFDPDLDSSRIDY